MKPGATTLPGRVDPCGRRARAVGLAGAEHAHPPVDDGDRAGPARRAGAVDDGPAADQQVGVLGHVDGARRPARALEAPAADPGARTMSGCARKMSRLDEVGRVVVVEAPGERRGEARVDGDQVGLLAGLERADRVVQAERSRAVERAEPQPVERAEDGRPRRRRASAAPSARRPRRA